MARLIRNGGSRWFALAALVLLGLASVSVVGENEQAVILRMGQPDRVINRFRPEAGQRASGAGLAFHLPLAESVVSLPRGLLTVGNEGQTVLTADDQALVLDAVGTVRVIDPVRLVNRIGSDKRIATEIGAWLPAMLKQELSRVDSGQVLRPGSGGAMAQVRKALDARMREFGVQVIDLRIARALLPAGAQSETLRAMGERREALAADERNHGARDVQQITSQAEVEAAALLQTSAGRDPEFYDFYRALRSYEAMFADSDRKDKATIVLPPDSGYLRQFNSR